MKNLRIHLVWLCITVVFGVAMAQFASKRERARAGDVAAASEAPREDAPASVTPRAGAKEPIPEADEEAPPEERPNRGDAPRAPRTDEELLAMLKDRNRRGRWRALREIRDIKDPARNLRLLAAVMKTDDGRLKREALQMLGDMGGPDATGLIISVLHGEDSDWIRSEAAEQLARIGGPLSVRALEQAFLDAEAGIHLKTGTAWALNRLGQSAPLEQMIAYHGQTLRDTDGALREDAVGYLGWLGTERALPYLEQALADPNSDVRREAIDALRDTHLDAARPIIETALQDPNPRVVQQAQEALERMDRRADER